jgi:septum formation protein
VAVTASEAALAIRPGGLAGGRRALQSAAPRLVLASGSAARRQLLLAAGLSFDVEAPDIDEAAIKAATKGEGGNAEHAAAALANTKASTVRDPDALVIGADQILVCGDTWYDKPATLDAARRQLTELRGRTHTLATAVCCKRGGQRVWRHLATPRLTMRRFSVEFLDAYIAEEGEALLGCVGAYRLEGRGLHLFDALEGEHSAILGLPMMPLVGFLRQSGVLLA